MINQKICIAIGSIQSQQIHEYKNQAYTRLATAVSIISHWCMPTSFVRSNAYQSANDV